MTKNGVLCGLGHLACHRIWVYHCICVSRALLSADKNLFDADDVVAQWFPLTSNACSMFLFAGADHFTICLDHAWDIDRHIWRTVTVRSGAECLILVKSFINIWLTICTIVCARKLALASICSSIVWYIMNEHVLSVMSGTRIWLHGCKQALDLACTWYMHWCVCRCASLCNVCACFFFHVCSICMCKWMWWWLICVQEIHIPVIIEWPVASLTRLFRLCCFLLFLAVQALIVRV